jgi:hypothetical protein
MHGGGDDQPDQSSEHVRKVERMQEAWRGQMPHLKDRYYCYLPENIARAAREREAKQSTMQEEVNAACSSSSDNEADGEVTYVGLSCVFQLKLPKICCGEMSTPHALQFGCFPSTPTTPHLWYDLDVLSMYMKLGLGDGLSGTGEWRGEGEGSRRLFS